MKMLGVILAGGQATRMGGGDKGLLRLGGVSLVERVIARLAPQVEGMALNANGDAARFSEFGLPVLCDPISGHPGPLAGVLAGLDWAAGEGASHVLSAAADTPFVPQNLGERLRAAGAPDAPVLAATEEGGKIWRQPTFGLWPVALRDDLRGALEGGLRRVVQWTDAHDGREVTFADARAFFNINTPEDLAAAEAML